MGRILKKPAVVGDEVVARQMLPLSLTFDHRVVDGAPAGAFLRDVKHAIEAAISGWLRPAGPEGRFRRSPAVQYATRQGGRGPESAAGGPPEKTPLLSNP